MDPSEANNRPARHDRCLVYFSSRNGGPSPARGVDSRWRLLPRSTRNTPGDTSRLRRHLVNDRLNHLMLMIKPTGYETTRNARRKRFYNAPWTPFDRMLDAEVLSQKQVNDRTANRISLSSAKFVAELARVRDRLQVRSSKETEQQYLATFPSAMSDVRTFMRVRTV